MPLPAAVLSSVLPHHQTTGKQQAEHPTVLAPDSANIEAQEQAWMGRAGVRRPMQQP